jgi:hypothetical protein
VAESAIEVTLGCSTIIAMTSNDPDTAVPIAVQLA